MFRTTSTIALTLLVLALSPAAARAEEPKRPWTDSAELSAVLTSGNSQTKNLAASNKFVYTWTEADLTIDAGVLRTESTARLLSNPAGTVVVEEFTATTAEAYSLAGKYRHTIREGFLWYAGAGWMRNRFSGVDDRYVAGGGLGYRFLQTDLHSLVGELGLDYTSEDRVNGTSADFAGARAYLGYARNLSPTAKFTTDLEVLENLDDTDDLRAKSVTALTASLSSRLALKVGYTMLYDKQPVELVIPGDTIGVADATFAFDKLDTVLSASLVINF